MDPSVSGVSMVMTVTQSSEGEWRAAPAGEMARVASPSTDARSVVTSFEDLYATQFVPMVRLATLLCGRVEVARDIVQDAFVALHVKWSGVEQPMAYLRQSVVNGCRSRARWDKLRRGQASTVEPWVEPEAAELNDVLARLPNRQRAAIVLRYYEGRTENEIADLLGCRPGSVGPLISRGLRSMRTELSGTAGTR